MVPCLQKERKHGALGIRIFPDMTRMIMIFRVPRLEPDRPPLITCCQAIWYGFALEAARNACGASFLPGTGRIRERRNGQFIANPGDLRVLNRGSYEGVLDQLSLRGLCRHQKYSKSEGVTLGMAGILKFRSNCSHVRLVFGSHAVDAVCRSCFEMGATLHDNQRLTNSLRQDLSFFFRRGIHRGWRCAHCRNAFFFALAVSISSSIYFHFTDS